MIDYIRATAAVALCAIILVIAVCFVYIIGFTLWQITKRICEGIEKGMDDR